MDKVVSQSGEITEIPKPNAVNSDPQTLQCVAYSAFSQADTAWNREDGVYDVIR